MPELAFLANMNISPLTVEDLRKSGWDIFRVSEVMNKTSKHRETLAYARDNNKIIITHDLDGLPQGIPHDYFTQREAKQAIDAAVRIYEWCKSKLSPET